MNPTSSRHSSADANSCISSHETESEWWIDAGNDAPDDSDSASSSAGDSPDEPRMRQHYSDKDVMQIDSDDESDRRDLKRKWVDTVEQGASSADADFPHSITAFRQQKVNKIAANGRASTHPGRRAHRSPDSRLCLGQASCVRYCAMQT